MNGWFKSWYFDQFFLDYITTITFVLHGHVMIWSKPTIFYESMMWFECLLLCQNHFYFFLELFCFTLFHYNFTFQSTTLFTTPFLKIVFWNLNLNKKVKILKKICTRNCTLDLYPIQQNDKNTVYKLCMCTTRF